MSNLIGEVVSLIRVSLSLDGLVRKSFSLRGGTECWAMEVRGRLFILNFSFFYNMR